MLIIESIKAQLQGYILISHHRRINITISSQQLPRYVELRYA